MQKSVAIIGTRGYPSYYGGFETAVRRLAPYLAEAGWDVVVYGRKGSTRDDDATRDPRVKTIVTAGVESRSISTLSYGLTSTAHAAMKKPDVVLLMNVANGFFLPMLKLRGIPTALNVDGIEWDRAKWGRLARFLFFKGAKSTARYADRLIFDADAIGARWRREFKRDGTFIPYGGDEPEPMAVPLGLEHRGYILLVARFVPENTVPEFIEAARELAEKWPVVIVGSSGYGGPLDEAVDSLSKQSPNVRWLGHVSDDRLLFALWQHAGVYFHGHSVGGTNPALVQAMACRVPIVARDTVYNREVLEGAGYFVEATPDAIVGGVATVMADPRLQDRMASDAFARSRQEYTWEVVCSRYEQLLLDLIDEKKAVVR